MVNIRMTILNYRLVIVMTYDSAVAVKRNEIDYMLQSLQSDISDGKTTWVFVIKQLSDVFHIIKQLSENATLWY